MSLILTSAKRNRSDNFDVDDIELLLKLVSQYSHLIDDSKLDHRKQAWDAITTKFNENCTGIKRDINALKMKVKNMKAQSKKPKIDTQPEILNSTEINPKNHKISEIDDDEEELDDNDDLDDQDYEEHEIQIENASDSSNNRARKRCKKFTKGECDLLKKLYEKHFTGLDSSCSASSVKKRSEAWESITNDFNKEQNTGIIRDINELKIKVKNIKAMRVKEESSLSQSNSLISIETETPVTVTKVVEVRKQNNDIIHASVIDSLYDEDFEEEYITPQPSSKNGQTSEEDKELEKIRRENVLLKNAVLRKKERLLELQIALAERSLRRQI